MPFSRLQLASHKRRSRPTATELVDLEGRRSTAGTVRKKATSSDSAQKSSRARGGLGEVAPLRRNLILRGVPTLRHSRETDSS